MVTNGWQWFVDSHILLKRPAPRADVLAVAGSLVAASGAGSLVVNSSATRVVTPATWRRNLQMPPPPAHTHESEMAAMKKDGCCCSCEGLKRREMQASELEHDFAEEGMVWNLRVANNANPPRNIRPF